MLKHGSRTNMLFRLYRQCGARTRMYELKEYLVEEYWTGYRKYGTISPMLDRAEKVWHYCNSICAGCMRGGSGGIMLGKL